ncbi:membrane associated rhomboid family serine protease [Paraburkholderia bannensis]|uniref:Membrane associated rhomboid family serine protease n=1 Tax=Paraburkholderia bannensis TaxID=765414 RepID=A0A7W9U6K6_9BURK|nr:membrane associated rhomboid family serine protease [Paraburkholderia sp. WP4_3_2]MBB6106895.1 membrane associated rhomboid family serine protease [Paraburkholderia bannensis]
MPFLHGSFGHLAFNMLGLFMFGREVERVVGARRMGTLYLASIVAGALTQLATMLWLISATTPAWPTIGASAGVFGALMAYALLFPERRVMLLFPPVPMPARLFAWGYAVVELVLGINRLEPAVAHFAHLGGMAAAAVLIIAWMQAGTLADGARVALIQVNRRNALLHRLNR